MALRFGVASKLPEQVNWTRIVELYSKHNGGAKPQFQSITKVDAGFFEDVMDAAAKRE